MKTQKNKNSFKGTEGLPKKNGLEWAIFGFSFLLVMFVLIYLIYQTTNARPSTPDISVTYKKDPSKNNPYRYKVFINNNGGETADEVIIEGLLMAKGEVIESAQMQIPFSPKLSQREGWINFSRNPSEADSISVRVVSYKKP